MSIFGFGIGIMNSKYTEMNIVSLLDEKTVLPNLEVDNKKDILDNLISSLSSKVNRQELETIRSAVFERERIMSTGVGKGLAIPHGKAPGIDKNYAAFARLKHPVDYEAIDGEPVSLVFLLVGPQSSNSMHIKMLSRISRLMNNNDFRQALKTCKSSKKIIELFKEEEQVHFGN